jgi:hypothetical protein
MIGPSKGLCLSGYPSLWDPWRVDRSLPLPDRILTSRVCSLVEARLLRSPWSGSRLRAESSNATPLRVRCDFLSESKRVGLISAGMGSEHLSLLPAEQCIS